MADNVVGNFAFVYNINRELYNYLYSAEKHARTDFRTSGAESRKALETFIKIILNKYNLTQACERQELSKKIENLRDEAFLRQEGYLKSGERLDNKRILPDLGTVSFQCENGQNKTKDYWDFIRQFGNRCVHGSRLDDPKLSYDSVIKCLKGLFLLLKRYYKGQISNSVGAFDENLMPIEEYCVYDSYIPDDSVKSKCIREFLAYTLDEKGEKNFYAILRLYNKFDSDEIFMLRNQKCFTEASKVSFSSVPDGMTRMEELVPVDFKNSSYYIISYVFNQEPHPLNNSLLKKMDLKQRVALCGRIVNCLEYLHTSPIPIFHRMLNYDCVFVCEIRNQWIPYIIKFDYAKIMLTDGTVYKDAARAKEFTKEETLSKYVAPEWGSLNLEADSLKWAKADIYSLGILCSEILYGKFSAKIPSIEDLEELDLSDELLDLLDYMRAEDPNERWAIEDVKDIFDEELRALMKRK